MNKYICIHGHFYQPPRENPWLEEIEQQDSAAPFHDWNMRITEECYTRNAFSRILDSEKRIQEVVSNYSRMSFNFGPTLLSWMERKTPRTYRAVLEADRRSMERFSGHGAAMAQCYSHMILPLANARDQQTQVIWGIRDFEHRFNRKPEGMWLAETAVDLATLDVLAEHGITFTVLAPNQAESFRLKGEKEWRPVAEAELDPKIPYFCRLPSGRTITLFFYDGPVSHDIAFGGLLNDGKVFSNRLHSAFVQDDSDQLVHIATDGETYGSHHQFGDMALAFCLHDIETGGRASLTVYGEYLEFHPPACEVRIHENSSWSCAHGVERWRSDCGCNAGRGSGWNQKWRGPLREALDWLRDRAADIYEEAMRKFCADPWAARNQYIGMVLDRSAPLESLQQLADSGSQISEEERLRAVKLLELQRHAMQMYTSCAWFFDDVSGIETVQVMMYAARVIQLAEETGGRGLLEDFRKRLSRVPSNEAAFGNAGAVFDRQVAPARLDLARVGAHYAISSLLEDFPETIRLYCYEVTSLEREPQQVGKNRMAAGKIRITSVLTREIQEFFYAAIYFGEFNFTCGLHQVAPGFDFSAARTELSAQFLRNDISDAIALVKQQFGSTFSLWGLFRDEQRKVVHELMRMTLDGVADSLRNIKLQNDPMLGMLQGMNIPLPPVLAHIAEFVDLEAFMNCLSAEKTDLARLGRIVEEINRFGLKYDKVKLSFEVTSKINSLMIAFENAPEHQELMEEAAAILNVLGPLHLHLPLWKAQDIFFFTGRRAFPDKKRRASYGDSKAGKWVESFRVLGKILGVKVD